VTPSLSKPAPASAAPGRHALPQSALLHVPAVRVRVRFRLAAWASTIALLPTPQLPPPSIFGSHAAPGSHCSVRAYDDTNVSITVCLVTLIFERGPQRERLPKALKLAVGDGGIALHAPLLGAGAGHHCILRSAECAFLPALCNRAQQRGFDPRTDRAPAFAPAAAAAECRLRHARGALPRAGDVAGTARQRERGDPGPSRPAWCVQASSWPAPRTFARLSRPRYKPRTLGGPMDHQGALLKSEASTPAGHPHGLPPMGRSPRRGAASNHHPFSGELARLHDGRAMRSCCRKGLTGRVASLCQASWQDQSCGRWGLSGDRKDRGRRIYYAFSVAYEMDVLKVVLEEIYPVGAPPHLLSSYQGAQSDFGRTRVSDRYGYGSLARLTHHSAPRIGGGRHHPAGVPTHMGHGLCTREANVLSPAPPEALCQGGSALVGSLLVDPPEYAPRSFTAPRPCAVPGQDPVSRVQLQRRDSLHS